MSLVLAVSSLVPLAILVAFATLVLFRRDLHTVRPLPLPLDTRSYSWGLLPDELPDGAGGE